MDRRCLAPKPDNRHHDDENAFDERRNRVRDWRNQRQKDEGENILREMEDTIEAEFEEERVGETTVVLGCFGEWGIGVGGQGGGGGV